MTSSYEYKPVQFFIITFVLSWIPWFIAAPLSTQDDMKVFASLIALLGLLGPSIAALYMILRSNNQALKKDFTKRLSSFRLWSPVYLLVTLLIAPVLSLAAIWLSLSIGESVDQFQINQEALGALLPMIILGMILAPTFEELGWRGYGVDSLRAKMGMLKSCVVFGVLWSLWHVPLVLIYGTYQQELVTIDIIYVLNFFVSIIPVGIVANWLYYKHNRSITAGIVLHSMLNASAMIMSAGQPAKTILTGLYILFVIVIVIFDKKLFGEEKRNFIS
jgi:hypothetical protein